MLEISCFSHKMHNLLKYESLSAVLELEDIDSADQAWLHVKSVIRDLVSRYAPERQVCQENRIPWLTRDTLAPGNKAERVAALPKHIVRGGLRCC